MGGHLGAGIAGDDLSDEGSDDLDVGDSEVSAGDGLGDESRGDLGQPGPAEVERQFRGDETGAAHLPGDIGTDAAGGFAFAGLADEPLLESGRHIEQGLGIGGECRVHGNPLCCQGLCRRGLCRRGDGGQYAPSKRLKSGSRFSAKAAAPSCDSGECA